MTAVAEMAIHPDPRVLTEWRTILNELPRYSVYQTPEWSQVLDASLPDATAAHRWVRFSDGVEAVLPLFSMPARFGLRKVESLPWGTYGGPLSCTPMTASHWSALFNACLTLRTPVLKWADVSDGHAEVLDALPIQRKAKATHVLAVDQPFDELFQQKVQSRSRTYIRRAQESGIGSTQRTDAEAASVFEAVYDQAKQYWSGCETYPDTFFEALSTALGDRLSIWQASRGDEVLSVNLMGYGGGEVQYIAGASIREEKPSHASRYLMSECIRDACERGFVEFNFGSSGDLPGVEQFKRSFSARERGYFIGIAKHHFARIFFGSGG